MRAFALSYWILVWFNLLFSLGGVFFSEKEIEQVGFSEEIWGDLGEVEGGKTRAGMHCVKEESISINKREIPAWKGFF